MIGTPRGAQSTGQMFVDQYPRFEGRKKKKQMRPNQVMGKNLIRPDKRKKVRYL
jgi:hypothetical protein